ncbi:MULTISPECIES: hypothetical protein [Fusobacterium]|uniref:hypothetical protein n=1 Tax=Fusobacterium TaxID=848 RepID=UPI0030CB24B9
MKKIFLIMSLIFMFSVSIFAENKNNSNNNQIIKITAIWKDNELTEISNNNSNISENKQILSRLIFFYKQIFYNRELKTEISIDQINLFAKINIFNERKIKESEFLYDYKNNQGTLKYYNEEGKLKLKLKTAIFTNNLLNVNDSVEAYDENGNKIDMNLLRDLVEIEGLWKNNNLSGTVKGMVYKDDKLFFQLSSKPLEESEFYEKHKKQLEEVYDNQNIIFKEVFDIKNQTLNTKVYNEDNILMTEEILYKKNDSFFKILKQFYTNGNVKEISNFKDGVQDGFHEIYNEDGSKKLLENYSDGKLISQENFNDEGFFIKTFTTLKNIAYKIRNIFTFIADFWIVFVFLVLPVIGILALIYEAIFKRKK